MEIQIRNSFPRRPPLFPGIRFPPPSASSPFIPNFSGPKPLQRLNVRIFFLVDAAPPHRNAFLVACSLQACGNLDY